MEVNQPPAILSPQPPPPPLGPAKTPLGVWSLVLGILSIPMSLFCMGTGLLVAIPAVICGHTALARMRRAGWPAGGIPLGGLITGYIGIGAALIFGPLMLAIAIPSFVSARSRSQEAACNNHLRQIAGATDQYALDHNGKRPAFVTDLVPDYIKQEPVCPRQGNYTIGGKDEDPACSVHGDLLNKSRGIRSTQDVEK